MLQKYLENVNEVIMQEIIKDIKEFLGVKNVREIERLRDENIIKTVRRKLNALQTLLSDLKTLAVKCNYKNINDTLWAFEEYTQLFMESPTKIGAIGRVNFTDRLYDLISEKILGKIWDLYVDLFGSETDEDNNEYIITDAKSYNLQLEILMYILSTVRMFVQYYGKKIPERRRGRSNRPGRGRSGRRRP